MKKVLQTAIKAIEEEKERNSHGSLPMREQIYYTSVIQISNQSLEALHKLSESMNQPVSTSVSKRKPTHTPSVTALKVLFDESQCPLKKPQEEMQYQPWKSSLQLSSTKLISAMDNDPKTILPTIGGPKSHLKISKPKDFYEKPKNWPKNLDNILCRAQQAQILESSVNNDEIHK